VEARNSKIMKGILYKQYGVWLVEYEDISYRRKIKKSIPVHEDDLPTIKDDKEYAIDYDFKDVEFDIVIVNNKLVAKMIEKQLPHIKIETDDEY
jgi:hypothetical protein